jgi:hypothetical protein
VDHCNQRAEAAKRETIDPSASQNDKKWSRSNHLDPRMADFCTVHDVFAAIGDIGLPFASQLTRRHSIQPTTNFVQGV